jgi:hypothetical protein
MPGSPVSPEESYERIKLRSRSCESTIPIEYLRRLHGAYEDFLEVTGVLRLSGPAYLLWRGGWQDISRIIPTIRVNYSRFHSVDEMAEMIIKFVCTPVSRPAMFCVIHHGWLFYFLTTGSTPRCAPFATWISWAQNSSPRREHDVGAEGFIRVLSW